MSRGEVRIVRRPVDERMRWDQERRCGLAGLHLGSSGGEPDDGSAVGAA